jgi:hypothetical protein
MTTTQRPGATAALPVRIAIWLAILGGAGLLAAALVATFIADHSSSDSSPSTITAILLATGGAAVTILAGLVLAGYGLSRVIATWTGGRRGR